MNGDNNTKPTPNRTFTASPKMDTFGRPMLYEVLPGGKLQRMGRRSYYMLLNAGYAVEVDWFTLAR